jgi:hypothetical protein
MDEHFHIRDSVQQVAASLLGIPIPDRAHIMAHALLLDDSLHVRAGA